MDDLSPFDLRDGLDRLQLDDVAAVEAREVRAPVCRQRLPVEIIAEVCRFPEFIIEVKKADAATDDLKALARVAREQIDGKKYDTTFRAEGIVDVEKIGLAYFKNAVEICRGPEIGGGR